MPRYEVGLRTNVAFREFRPVLAIGEPPETVAIEFDDRRFVWHMNEPGPEGEEYGPTLTVVAQTEAEYRDELPEAAERFLSAIAYWLDLAVGSESYGGSGIGDPLARALLRVPRAGFVWHVSHAPERIEVHDDVSLNRALAVYREGLNATSPFYGFLAFWNVLDAVFDGDDPARDEFIDRKGPDFRHSWPDGVPWPDELATELRHASRNAIAHIVRPPHRVVIDPDLPADRARLHGESRFLSILARGAVTTRWPYPVRVLRAL